ncbi:hypothetical protein E6O75_ATG09968 [Venturia nashicola]|uniref:Uncharacterized protein n=1 Tax=Venturia nashicola TaxID=86259 RepID=A0A4Z1NQ50_9PEZI|nr:hypothetical protein E6O75_ATG09968 [Venturia nashicola]
MSDLFRFVKSIYTYTQLSLSCIKKNRKALEFKIYSMTSQHSDSDNKTENHVHRDLRSVLPSPRSSTKRKRKADDSSQKESEPNSTLKSTKSRKIENQEKNLSPPTQTNTKTTTTKPPSRKKRRKYSPIPANTTTNQPTRSRVDLDLYPPSQPQPQPTPPHSKRETQTDPASIPPRNGTSPFSRLPPELRQMILYRVFDVDEEAANRLPLGFDRFMDPVERARAMRFGLIKQRRDTLLMVEGEWGRVGVEWAGDARVVLEKVWKEVMGAESEVFG